MYEKLNIRRGRVMALLWGLIKCLNMTVKRMVIKSNEIAEILGVNENTARGYIRTLKVLLGKKSYHKITIAEFCSYFDLDFPQIFCQINNITIDDFNTLVENGHVILPEFSFTSSTTTTTTTSSSSSSSSSSSARV